MTNTPQTPGNSTLEVGRIGLGMLLNDFAPLFH